MRRAGRQVAVVSREQDPLYGNIIEITYFGNPAEAEAYLDPSLLPTVSAQRERLADTVTADYSASYGSAGPPELESIKSCLANRQTARPNIHLLQDPASALASAELSKNAN